MFFLFLDFCCAVSSCSSRWAQQLPYRLLVMPMAQSRYFSADHSAGGIGTHTKLLTDFGSSAASNFLNLDEYCMAIVNKQLSEENKKGCAQLNTSHDTMTQSMSGGSNGLQIKQANTLDDSKMRLIEPSKTTHVVRFEQHEGNISDTMLAAKQDACSMPQTTTKTKDSVRQNGRSSVMTNEEELLNAVYEALPGYRTEDISKVLTSTCLTGNGQTFFAVVAVIAKIREQEIKVDRKRKDDINLEYIRKLYQMFTKQKSKIKIKYRITIDEQKFLKKVYDELPKCRVEDISKVLSSSCSTGQGLTFVAVVDAIAKIREQEIKAGRTNGEEINLQYIRKLYWLSIRVRQQASKDREHKISLMRNQHTDEFIEQIRQMAKTLNDKQIAERANHANIRTLKGAVFLEEDIRKLRCKHKIQSFVKPGYTKEFIEEVRQLARTLNDKQIAEKMKDAHVRTLRGFAFSEVNISWIRCRYKIPSSRDYTNEFLEQVRQLARTLTDKQIAEKMKNANIRTLRGSIFSEEDIKKLRFRFQIPSLKLVR